MYFVTFHRLYTNTLKLASNQYGAQSAKMSFSRAEITRLYEVEKHQLSPKTVNAPAALFTT